AVGSVKWPVLSLYLRSMGPWWFWVAALTVFGLQQLSAVFTNIWVREWSNQYNVESSTNTSALGYHSNLNTLLLKPQEASSGYFSTNPAFITASSWVQKANSFTIMSTVAPEVDSVYYITVLAIIGILG